MAPGEYGNGMVRMSAPLVASSMNRAQAGYVAVIDADLQHPPQQLRVLYDQAVAQDADLVVASRYMVNGGA